MKGVAANHGFIMQVVCHLRNVLRKAAEKMQDSGIRNKVRGKTMEEKRKAEGEGLPVYDWDVLAPVFEDEAGFKRLLKMEMAGLLEILHKDTKEYQVIVDLFSQMDSPQRGIREIIGGCDEKWVKERLLQYLHDPFQRVVAAIIHGY